MVEVAEVVDADLSVDSSVDGRGVLVEKDAVDASADGEPMAGVDGATAHNSVVGVTPSTTAKMDLVW